jgi:hypothetical protein
MAAEEKYSIVDREGRNQELEIAIEDYKAAGDAGLSLTQYLTRKIGNDINLDHGNVLEQCMSSCGMFLRPDGRNGIQPVNMKDVLDGGLQLSAAVVRNDGSSRHTVTGRLLFPEVILQIMQENLTEDKGDFLQAYAQMIAQTQSVTSPRVDQPQINTTAPEDSRSQPQAQLAEPSVMVQITLNDKSYTIPTKSIGLEISDQARQATTLDLVSLAMTAQARGEQIAMVEDQLKNMIDGDTDIGETAISAVTAQSYDSSISGAGEITQKAWIKFLRKEYRKRNIDWCVMDLDTALAVENRTNKPNVQGDDPNSPRLDAIFTVENLGFRPPRVLLVDTTYVGANTIVGLDSRFAIRRIINVSATYSAIEEFVMRRKTGFRVDYGQIAHKLYPEAWHKMTLTV